MPSTPEMIAQAIASDLCDRQGFKQTWGQLDEETKQDILGTWRRIGEICMHGPLPEGSAYHPSHAMRIALEARKPAP